MSSKKRNGPLCFYLLPWFYKIKMWGNAVSIFFPESLFYFRATHFFHFTKKNTRFILQILSLCYYQQKNSLQMEDMKLFGLFFEKPVFLYQKSSEKSTVNFSSPNSKNFIPSNVSEKKTCLKFISKNDPFDFKNFLAIQKYLNVSIFVKYKGFSKNFLEKFSWTTLFYAKTQSLFFLTTDSKQLKNKFIKKDKTIHSIIKNVQIKKNNRLYFQLKIKMGQINETSTETVYENLKNIKNQTLKYERMIRLFSKQTGFFAQHFKNSTLIFDNGSFSKILFEEIQNNTNKSLANHGNKNLFQAQSRESIKPFCGIYDSSKKSVEIDTEEHKKTIVNSSSLLNLKNIRTKVLTNSSQKNLKKNFSLSMKYFTEIYLFFFFNNPFFQSYWNQNKKWSNLKKKPFDFVNKKDGLNESENTLRSPLFKLRKTNPKSSVFSKINLLSKRKVDDDHYLQNSRIPFAKLNQNHFIASYSFLNPMVSEIITEIEKPLIYLTSNTIAQIQDVNSYKNPENKKKFFEKSINSFDDSSYLSQLESIKSKSEIKTWSKKFNDDSSNALKDINTNRFQFLGNKNETSNFKNQNQYGIKGLKNQKMKKEAKIHIKLIQNLPINMSEIDQGSSKKNFSEKKFDQNIFFNAIFSVPSNLSNATLIMSPIFSLFSGKIAT
nr:hypothetical protein [Trentepohlia sp. YN1242]